MACVSRYVLQLSETQFGEAPKSVGELMQFVNGVHAYSDDVCNMLKMDAVLATLDILLTDLVSNKS
jgi:hypothetical protein